MHITATALNASTKLSELLSSSLIFTTQLFLLVSGVYVEGNRSIVGFMVESNLAAGNQKIPANKADLQYGVSITDACVDWATTEDMVKNLRERVKDVLPNRPSLTIDDLMEHSA